MNVLVLRQRLQSVFAAAAVCAIYLAVGKEIADNGGSPAIVLALLIAICGAVLFAVGTEYILLICVVTAPIGLEQVTGGERSLAPGLGGWAVSSLRLGLLLAATVGILAVKGLPRRPNVQEIAYAALVLYLTAALAVSPDVFNGVRFTAKIAVIGLAWFAFGWIVRRWSEELVWRLLLWTLAFAIAADVLMAALGLGYREGDDYAERFGGITGSPAAASLCVGVLAMPALYLWLRSRHKVALALYLLAWIPIFISLTRISIAAFIAGSVLMPILMGRARYAVIVLVLLGGLTLSYAPLRERTAWGASARSWDAIVQTIETSGTANLNTGGRENLWRPLWREWHEHPAFGSGTGASAEVLARSTNDAVTQAHSDYLALLVNGGVFALGLWLFALLGLVVRFVRRGGRACVAAAGIVMYLIAAITDNSIEMYAAVGIPLALLIALALEPESRPTHAEA